MTESQRLIEIIHRIYEGEPWYGTPLIGLLKGVDAKKALAKPLPNCHSIWELVLHMGTWERVVANRISGKREKADANWPKITETNERAWNAAVKRLLQANKELRAILKRTSDDDLYASRSKKSPGRKYIQAIGVIEHTMYHAGQIAMLKKALRRKSQVPNY